MEEKRVELTWELIHSVSTGGKGAWTKEQLKIMGVKWPPKKGWLFRCIGRTITEKQLAELQRLRDERKAYNQSHLNFWDVA